MITAPRVIDTKDKICHLSYWRVFDRTGKSSVAEYFKSKGYELIHQSAPPKDQSPENFMEEQIQLVSSAAHKDVVLDRSYYGELVWPQIYGRDSLLSEENLEVLRELEDSVVTSRILMYDPNVEAHWKRCVDNKEPLTKVQFIKARNLFSSLIEKYGFARKTLLDFPEIPVTEPEVQKAEVVKPDVTPVLIKPTKEQIKLQTANAINDILSKRIVKQKGQVYDQIEINLRVHLNNELGKLLGTTTEAKQQQAQFTAEEADLLRMLVRKMQEKQ